MAEPRASVVIPSYNHGRFVEAAVESVLDQDADLELVVVDDGSTDDSRERLAPFAADPRVRMVEQQNRGAHAALNRGLGLAGGQILFILNSDDLFEPGRVRRFLERFAADPGIAVLASWLRVIDEGGGEEEVPVVGVAQVAETQAIPGDELAAEGDVRGSGDIVRLQERQGRLAGVGEARAGLRLRPRGHVAVGLLDAQRLAARADHLEP